MVHQRKRSPDSRKRAKARRCVFKTAPCSPLSWQWSSFWVLVLSRTHVRHLQPQTLHQPSAIVGTFPSVSTTVIHSCKTVFSREDGVIRWYPQVAAAGKKAKLGVYLETYGVTVDTKGITFPADQNKGVSYKVDTDKCKDENGKEVDATVQVIVWEKASDSTVSKRYITDFKNIRIDRDEMAITIAFVPTGADIPMPDSAEKLAEIVAAEYGAAPTTTVKGATTTSVAAPTTTGG